jgi:hypothetical protein
MLVCVLFLVFQWVSALLTPNDHNDPNDPNDRAEVQDFVLGVFIK